MDFFFAHYNIKKNPTGQKILGRSSCTLKDMLNKKKEAIQISEIDSTTLYEL